MKTRQSLNIAKLCGVSRMNEKRTIFIPNGKQASLIGVLKYIRRTEITKWYQYPTV